MHKAVQCTTGGFTVVLMQTYLHVSLSWADSSCTPALDNELGMPLAAAGSVAGAAAVGSQLIQDLTLTANKS
jgi:hypothetical protein